MKKYLLVIALISLILVMTSCKKQEEVTISKYFQAMLHGEKGDINTMSAMALEPVYIQYESYKIISVS